VDNHHFKKCIGCRQESPHDDLQQWLALKVLLFGRKLDIQLTNETHDLLLLVSLDGVEDLEDRIKDELVESTLKAALAILGPLLGLWVEVVIALTCVSVMLQRLVLLEEI
jgi:hypothetical protein